MSGLVSAIRFITVLPAGKATAFEPRAMIPYFPVVGILLGGLLALFDYAALHFWPRSVVSLLDVMLLIGLTGGFHMDGLGDTADGLMSHRSRDQMLAIMKDSRVGAMGLIAVVCVFCAKWAGLSALDGHRSLLLILIPAYARGSMLFGIRFLRYGRPGGGTAFAFFQEPLPWLSFSGMLLPVFLSFLLGWRGLGLLVGFAAITALVLLYYRKKMGCITGDMLGAMTEINEAALFLLCAAGGAP